MRSEARIGPLWSQVPLVLEDGRPRELLCLMGSLAGGGSRADSADTTASVRRGVKREWMIGKGSRGYPLEAPKARAIWRKPLRNGNETGR